jgi:ankyrin repeat protein
MAQKDQKIINAAANGDYGKVVSLVKKGRDVNAVNTLKWTPLAYACKYGYLEITKHLVENGADVNMRINTGASLLQIALNGGYLKIAEYLIKNRVKLNTKDIVGMTPLHWSAKEGSIKAVKLLVDNGADINAKNSSSRTILDVTISAEVKKYLISMGAKTGKQLFESNL